MLFRPKIQYPTPETINRKCTGRKILSTVLHDVLCIRISVQMHIMHKIKAGLALFNTIKGLRVLCISSMDSGKPFFWNKRKSSFDAHFVTFDRHTAAAVGGRRGYPQAPAFKLDARAPRINRTPGAGEGNSRLAIDTTYPAYLTGSALNRPSRRAAVYHAFLMQCAYTRNSAQCERAAGGPRPSRPQAAQTARAAACADRSH